MKHPDLLARNPNTDPETLALLAKDRYPLTGWAWYVALNTNASFETLTSLSQSNDSRLRLRVACNPSAFGLWIRDGVRKLPCLRVLP